MIKGSVVPRLFLDPCRLPLENQDVQKAGVFPFGYLLLLNVSKFSTFSTLIKGRHSSNCQQKQIMPQQEHETKATKTPSRDRWDRCVELLVLDLTKPITREKYEEVSCDIFDVSNKWFDRVLALYNEPHRAYHNWTHVDDVLASLDFLLEGKQQQADEVKCDVIIATFSAFFHDVIYNPKSSTNEKDSADLFVEFLTELSGVLSKHGCGVKNSQMKHGVVECIIATASHISSAMKANQSGNEIVSIFLDADISILGKCADDYNKYAVSIRKEYSFVERDVYCEKRAEILQSFLPVDAEDTPKTGVKEDERSAMLTVERRHNYIFATERGRLRWEENARQNLKREIEMLQQGTIPSESI